MDLPLGSEGSDQGAVLAFDWLVPGPVLRTRRARRHVPGSPPVHAVALFAACRVVLAHGEGMRAPR
jgi:hypothetical protein